MSEPVVRIEADLQASTAERFIQDAQLIHQLYQLTREEQQIPDYAVTIILADRFVETLKRYQYEAVPTQINVDKVGGVAAKNLWQKDDFSEVVIVVDAKEWRTPEDPDSLYRIPQLSLLTHELAHPLVERARWAGGAGLRLIPNAASRELARGLTHGIAGEYHADRLSQIAMGVLLSMPADGENRPFIKWPYIEAWARADLATTLMRAHATWPELVQTYRTWQIDLTTMWQQLTADISDTLVVLMHRCAAADQVGAGDLLAQEPFASAPATRLYLADTWPPFRDELRQRPPLLPQNEWAPAEDALGTIGERMFFEIWRRLGVDVVKDSEGALTQLLVREPLR